jgi:DNA-binding winged helix-turn-helix (wHTH) protein
MDHSMITPRKYFVVVTHNPATQLELEAILSRGQYNAFGTSLAQIYVEGLTASPIDLDFIERFSPASPLINVTTDHNDSAIAQAMKKSLPPSETWQLGKNNRVLAREGVKVVLTAIEAALVKKMLHHNERVVSKDDLIRSIGREPEHYRGLEMCLSRLQDKFKNACQGERLFRAVRNRGYCLIQKIVRGN